MQREGGPDEEANGRASDVYDGIPVPSVYGSAPGSSIRAEKPQVYDAKESSCVSQAPLLVVVLVEPGHTLALVGLQAVCPFAPYLAPNQFATASGHPFGRIRSADAR